MVLVKDYRNTPAITVTPSTSIGDCLKMMQERKIRHLLVVEGDKLHGIVVRKDIESALREPSRFPETPVEWIMSKNLVTIENSAKMLDALYLMDKHKYSGLPVLDNGKVIGMFTESDVVKTLIKLLETE